MAGSRTLKLSILGDVDNLNKSLKTATADVETFGDKVGKVGKVIGAAFVAAAAAAGAYAVKIGIDGVKAALEDEKAQRILALTLENTTGATNAQIAAVETYITKTALATGVTDDKLRPALSRLVRSTKDTEEAQKLLALSLDISSATGKPLELIANSLGKAYDGNTNALGKLGLGIDASILKTKDFNQVYENLRGSFAGFADQEANTFQGRLDRLNVAFDEAKETIGFALLPVLEKVITFINDNALPVINAFAGAFGNKESGITSYISTLTTLLKNLFVPIIEGLVKAFGYVKDAIGDNLKTFQEFGGYIAKYLAPIIGETLGGALQVVGKIAGGVIDIVGAVVGAINKVINVAIDGINFLIRAYNSIPFLGNVSELGKITFSSGGVSGGTPGAISGGGVGSFAGIVAGLTDISTGLGTTDSAASAGKSSGGNAGVQKALDALIAQRDDLVIKAEILKTQMGLVTPSPLANFRASEQASGGGTTINFNITGAIDKEGTARSVNDLLNNSYYRGTGGALNLAGLTP